MSFSRAFSTRRKEPEIEISLPMYIGRAASQRGGKPVPRAQISSPMALVSTSNQHIHRAQTINGTSPIEIRHVSNGSTSSSSEDSDTTNASIHSHDTVTDASSVDNSPITPEPEANHLSCYFKPAVDTTHSRSTSALTSPTSPTFDTTPRLPHRAPSHSKRAHEGVHRKRSVQRMLSPPPSRGGSIDHTTRSSAEIIGIASPKRAAFVEAPKDTNPFGRELAQLDEVAEEFGQVVRSAERDADAVYMEAHGLGRFTAGDYAKEIQDVLRWYLTDEEVPPRVDFGGFF